MLKYYVFDPAGNVTLLVDTYVKTADQPRVAAELMRREPLCEQVGFARVCGHNGKPEGHLRMAGGEFCGNASMCTAVLKKIKEKNNGITHYYPDGIDVAVSGTKGKVNVKVTEDADGTWVSEGTFFWPRSFGEIMVDGKRRPLIDCGGISHVIFEEKPDRKKAEKLIRSVCEENGLNALGFMFFSEGSLIPLVFVRDIGTLYWESSCASGSTAVAAWLAEVSAERKAEAVFTEPGGELSLFADADKKYVKMKTKIRLLKGVIFMNSIL